MKKHPLTTCEAIQLATCIRFDISCAELTGPERMQHFARPRFLAAKMIRDRTKLSLPEIGRRFGNRDHTTIKSAIARANQLIAEDPELRGSYERISRSTAEFGAPIYVRHRDVMGYFKSRRAAA